MTIKDLLPIGCLECIVNLLLENFTDSIVLASYSLSNQKPWSLILTQGHNRQIWHLDLLYSPKTTTDGSDTLIFDTRSSHNRRIWHLDLWYSPKATTDGSDTLIFDTHSRPQQTDLTPWSLILAQSHNRQIWHLDLWYSPKATTDGSDTLIFDTHPRPQQTNLTSHETVYFRGHKIGVFHS